MAVNENLYSWMLKTYGMGAAEWYRNNPGAKPGANPYLPKGAYVPLAKGGQQTGPRGETLASVSPDIETRTLVEPAPKQQAPAFKGTVYETLYNLPETDYEAQRQQASTGGYRFDSEEQLKQYYPGASYTKIDIPRYGDILISDVGIGFKDIGSGANYLFNKYIDSPEFDRLANDYEKRLYPAMRAASYGSPEYKALEAEANQNRNATRALAYEYNRLYSGKPVEGYDENAFYAKVDLPTRQNLSILKAQAEAGNSQSQEFLDNYLGNQQETEPAERGPRGEETFKERGPRGEDMGDIAWNTPAMPQGPYTPVRNFGTKDKPFYGPSTKDTHNNPSGERVIQMRYEAEAPSFDEQKALIARQAADEYRRRGQVEDPFRSGSFG
jgi:hypothetical protein